MKNTDLRAKARAIFGSAVAEPMPKQPNGAKALQQRANARPIPTYKVGGPVKKMPTPADSVASGNRMSKMEADESRFMDMLDKKKKMPSAREAVDSANRMSKMEADEMRLMGMTPKPMAGARKPLYEKRQPAPAAEYKKGGKVQTSADTAEKLATEMGGMKKGGKAAPKSGLAVMIAIGKVKPTKKMNGGPMAARGMDMEAAKLTRQMAHGGAPMGYMAGGAPMGYAAGGAGKTRKGQAPIKKAQGGAAKVRKGMMTPGGDIIDVMNKIRGK